MENTTENNENKKTSYIKVFIICVIALVLIIIYACLTTPNVPNSKFSSLAIGDYISIGHYEQDADYNNGSEPIEWIVIEKNQDNILLLSKYALEVGKFDDYSNDLASSELYKWLNNKFYTESFIDEKDIKEQISEVTLLSYEQAMSLYENKDIASCEPSNYVLTKLDDNVKENRDAWAWWLSTPYVDIDQTYQNLGDTIDRVYVGNCGVLGFYNNVNENLLIRPVLSICTSANGNATVKKTIDINTENDYHENVVTGEKPLGTITCSENINIRINPDENSAKVGKANKGETYNFYEKAIIGEYTWYRISSGNDKSKWIASDGDWVIENDSRSPNQNQVISNENTNLNNNVNSETHDNTNTKDNEDIGLDIDDSETQKSDDPVTLDLHHVVVRINIKKDYFEKIDISSNYQIDKIESTIYVTQESTEDIFSKVNCTYFNDSFTNTFRGNPATITMSFDPVLAEDYKDYSFEIDVQKFMKREGSSDNTWLSFKNENTITFSLDEWEMAIVMISIYK